MTFIFDEVGIDMSTLHRPCSYASCTKTQLQHDILRFRRPCRCDLRELFITQLRGQAGQRSLAESSGALQTTPSGHEVTFTHGVSTHLYLCNSST
jgi:hypothetical protein